MNTGSRASAINLHVQLQGLNESLHAGNEATREKMKKALTKKKVLVTAGKTRKWVGIPLMNKDGAAVLQTAMGSTEEQKREAEKVALEKAKTAKVLHSCDSLHQKLLSCHCHATQCHDCLVGAQHCRGIPRHD